MSKAHGKRERLAQETLRERTMHMPLLQCLAAGTQTNMSTSAVAAFKYHPVHAALGVAWFKNLEKPALQAHVEHAEKAKQPL